MVQKALRFGIRDSEDRRAATWKLWTETANKSSEVYLACRGLGGFLKTSLHESGQWHTSYSQQAYEKHVQGAIPSAKDRFLERWPRPPEFAAGTTLAFRIVTPFTATTIAIAPGEMGKIHWIDNAPQDMATEIDILITKSSPGRSEWPGKNSMSTQLIGAIPLQNGDTVWAVHWTVEMPDLSGVGSAPGHFYHGRTRADLKNPGLRAFVFGANKDGSRVIYDCPVQHEG